jgi:uncharacterized damage-inducible protein DinB
MKNSLARLLALATEIEKEGQYNGSKLLRAAHEALANRSSTEVEVPADASGQAALLESTADELAGSPASVLAGPLRATARALRAGGVPLYDEAPDPHVCRICGETSLEPFGARCPTCGRWPNTTNQHRPIYWLRASTPPEALELLAQTPNTVASIIAAGDTHTPGPDGGWSAHQTLEHLNNAQSIFRGRIDQLLAGGEPELASVMVWKMGADELSTLELFEQYSTLRTEILAVLNGAPLEAWWNRASHEEFGMVTLAEQTSYFANHEPTHLAQLEDAVQRRSD